MWYIIAQTKTKIIAHVHTCTRHAGTRADFFFWMYQLETHFARITILLRSYYVRRATPRRDDARLDFAHDRKYGACILVGNSRSQMRQQYCQRVQTLKKILFEKRKRKDWMESGSMTQQQFLPSGRRWRTATSYSNFLLQQQHELYS